MLAVMAVMRRFLSAAPRRAPPAVLVGGGVGPAAGVALHQRLVAHTRARGDGDHLHVVHCSRSAHVADRTAFLLGGGDANAVPAPSPEACDRAQNSGLESMVPRNLLKFSEIQWILVKFSAILEKCTEF